MHPHLKPLIALQSIYLRLNELRGALAAYPKLLAEVDARVAAAQAYLAKSKESLTGSLLDRKKFELDVDQWKQRVRKYKDQLYEVKSNEAYKTLQHEIQMGEEEITKSEDRLLERMMAGEEFERQVKSAEASLKKVEAEAKAERAKIQADQAETQKLADDLAAERAQAVSAVPEDMLDHYQRIAKRHNGVAMAEVQDETCTMCRVRVRPHVFQELRRAGSEEIFHCETCTRILYYVEDAAGSPERAMAQNS